MGLCAFSPLHYMLKQSASIRGKEIRSLNICGACHTLRGSSCQLPPLVKHTRAAGAFTPGLKGRPLANEEPACGPALRRL